VHAHEESAFRGIVELLTGKNIAAMGYQEA
jgi:hypothetical protein